MIKAGMYKALGMGGGVSGLLLLELSNKQYVNKSSPAYSMMRDTGCMKCTIATTESADSQLPNM